MVSTFRNTKRLALTLRLCLLLAAYQLPTEVKAESDSVIVEKTNDNTQFESTLINTEVKSLKKSQSKVHFYPNEQIIWNAGSPWSDKFLEVDSFPWTEMLEEIISLIT